MQTLRILGAEGAVEVTYGKRDNDGRSLETLIEDSEGKHRMRMRLRDIRGAETFPDKVFKIRLPQGVEKLHSRRLSVSMDLCQNTGDIS